VSKHGLNQFKDKSTQNKANRGSARGGALHSTGRKSHSDIAVALVSTCHRLT